MTLWFFRTPGGDYGLAQKRPRQAAGLLDAGALPVGVIVFNRRPRGFPPLDPGECIPVKLVAEGKGKTKGKSK